MNEAHEAHEAHEGRALAAYAAGSLDGPAQDVVEAHVLRCAGCRARLAELADRAGTERVWATVRDRVQTPARPPVVRLLQRLGLTEADGVVLGALEPLRGAWPLGSLLVLVAAVGASAATATPVAALTLLVAPLVPVLLVAGAFAAADPLRALTSATPASRLRLALVRTLAVVLPVVPVAVLLGALLPGVGAAAVVWLGPALALITLALVAMTRWSPPAAATGVCAAWVAVVVAALGRGTLAGLVHGPAQLVYLLVAAVAAALLVARSRARHVPGGYA